MIPVLSHKIGSYYLNRVTQSFQEETQRVLPIHFARCRRRLCDRRLVSRSHDIDWSIVWSIRAVNVKCARDVNVKCAKKTSAVSDFDNLKRHIGSCGVPALFLSFISEKDRARFK